MQTPFWLDEPARRFHARGLAARPDVEIVGGGVTGCTAALVLGRGGLRVRLHEARLIASGASGRNGGFALRGGAMPYDLARSELGRARSQDLWQLSERALDHLEELAGDTFRRTSSLRLAADEAERDELQREHDALSEDGFAVSWEDELPAPLRGRFHGALRHGPDGALHPARWVHRLATLAETAGADLREGSKVQSLADLEAETVIVATDGYTHGLLPELDRAVRPTRGQVVATEPLPARIFECPHYARHGYDYWQQLPDRRLVIGGWRDASLEREATAVEETTPVVQRKIERFLRDLLGATPRITHRWAGIFGVTSDRLPLAGRLPGSDRVWVACGYSGHGNVLGLACGELVAKEILGRAAPELALFDPVRLMS